MQDLLARAVERRASDIHLTVSRRGPRVRLRVDGLLHDVPPPPLELYEAAISRIKIMSGLDIAERRLPQDGSTRAVVGGREVDLRAATMPHLTGEGVVLRILDRSALSVDLDELGVSRSFIGELTTVLSQPNGLILMTGPTGSGKTTTLYAALRAIVRAVRPSYGHRAISARSRVSARNLVPLPRDAKMSRRRRAGFTLLELTVSLAISALAVAGLAHLVQDAARLDSRLSERLRNAGEAEALFTVLEQLLSDSPLELSGEAMRLSRSSAQPSVSGSAQAVTILSRGPRVLGLTEPTAFTLAFNPGSAPDRGQVLLTWSSPMGMSELEVVVHARAFAIRYAAASGRGELDWAESWARPVATLALVEASYVEAMSGRRVSRLLASVPSLPSICVLRPLLEGCPEWR